MDQIANKFQLIWNLIFVLNRMSNYDPMVKFLMKENLATIT